MMRLDVSSAMETRNIMKYFIVAIFALITQVLARPQEPAPSGSPTTPVTIVNQTDVVGTDGSYNYSYETSNGIRVEQGGYLKKAAEARSAPDPNNPDDTGDVQVIQGAYSYTAPDGQQISLTYVADDNGFQPHGEHLPTAPPVPEGIARSLEQQQQEPQQQHQVLDHQQQQTVQPQQPLLQQQTTASHTAQP